jgi:hypothetical protein
MSSALFDAVAEYGYGDSDSAGSCHCCGAKAMYLGYFVHCPTGKIHTFGERCTENIGIGCKSAFDHLRKGVKGVRAFKQGKAKAKTVMMKHGFHIDIEWLKSRPFDRVDLPAHLLRSVKHAQETMLSMHANLVKYGSWSVKQIEFAGKLIDQIVSFDAKTVKAKYEAERANQATILIEVGRHEIEGKIISTKLSDGWYGRQLQMLVLREDGAKFWGSCPDALKGDRGDSVKFTANIKPKEGEPGFAFFSRPSNAVTL